MENEAAGRASIKAREEIVQPLLTIQQYALMELQILRKQNSSTKFFHASSSEALLLKNNRHFQRCLLNAEVASRYR